MDAVEEASESMTLKENARDEVEIGLPFANPTTTDFRVIYTIRQPDCSQKSGRMGIHRWRNQLP